MWTTDRDFLAGMIRGGDEISVDENFIGTCINEYILAVNTIYWLLSAWVGEGLQRRAFRGQLEA